MIHRGIATFGLDTGTCPRWLFERMVKIPDKPAIPLNNWLLDLTSKDDPKRSSVFIIGIKSIVNDLWDEIDKSKKLENLISKINTRDKRKKNFGKIKRLTD